MIKNGVCKHFRGVQHELCIAGINWRKVTGGDSFGIATRMPCFKKNNSPAKCSHYVEPTQQEIDREEIEFKKLICRMEKAAPIISNWREKLPIGKSEIIKCPVCGGKLHLSQAACNGHIHGRCETKDCLQWME